MKFPSSIPMPSERSTARVAVLMSTYNGERHVKEQIESILPQLSEQDRLFVRDDGSTDDTITIIQSISDSRIKLTLGVNIGFARSFFWLLYHATEGFDICMLSDQDDIWLPGKIDRAWKFVSSTPEPVLYCSRLRIVDENLLIAGLSPEFAQPPTLTNAVCENIATGCTIALNCAAVAAIKVIPYSNLAEHYIYYHDWWLYLNISHFGKVVWDSEPRILYRQHSGNLVGMSGGWRRYWHLWKAVRRRSWVRVLILQLRAFLYLHESRLDKATMAWISSLCMGSPIRVAFVLMTDKKLRRQWRAERWLFKLLVGFDFILGKLKNLPTTSSRN